MAEDGDAGPAGPTAGFRNAGWTMEHLPAGTSVLVQPLQTLDAAATNGFLFSRGAPRTVVCIMHPREFLATHYLIPHILDAGCAVWTQASRSVGNDLRLEHEIVLHDVAAAMLRLRKLGFEKIVLLGNSGGSSLYMFYNQLALLASERRLERTPGGRPTRLAEADMPAADGVVLVAPHPGQGLLLMNAIDPSVADEADPFSVDPALDFMAPANGFKEPPESAGYAADFVARYRAGQRARVARLDDMARAAIKERLAARKRAKERPSRDDAARGAHQSIMEIWRTDADLRCFDLSLDPSDRSYGSVWGRNPYASNYGSVGFARLCTPESWLSTWSGLSSKAAMPETLKSVEQPTLVVEYSGDNTIFPADVDALYAVIPARDKSRVRFRGDHHGRPLARGEAPGRDAAGAHIGRWLKERFPAA
jgi:pimeloyl-ACP methyl ester carboxylesterase